MATPSVYIDTTDHCYKILNISCSHVNHILHYKTSRDIIEPTTYNDLIKFFDALFIMMIPL
jgi:DNA-directed RNA polymerase beta' subunit